MIRLFHREIEAYVVADGVFDDHVAENGNVFNILACCMCCMKKCG